MINFFTLQMALIGLVAILSSVRSIRNAEARVLAWAAALYLAHTAIYYSFVLMGDLPIKVQILWPQAIVGQGLATFASAGITRAWAWIKDGFTDRKDRRLPKGR